MRRLLRRLGPRIGILWQHQPRPLRSPPRRVYAGAAPPRISIATPSYNQGAYLERTLRSVLEQGYPNLEYIVQDGASTDGSVEVLDRYRDRLSYWESQKDGGQTDAINRGFRRSSGEIMAYLNSDDLLLPGALARVAEAFDRHPEVDVVYGHRVIIDEEDREIGRWLLPQHDGEALTWLDTIPQETLFWRRRIWNAIGASLDDSFHFAMDWDLLLRFREAKARFVRLPHFLGAFRLHSTQKTSSSMSTVGAREILGLRRRSHGREVTEEEAWRRVRFYLGKHVAQDLVFRLTGWAGREAARART